MAALLLSACDTIPMRGDDGQAEGEPGPSTVEAIPLEDFQSESRIDGPGIDDRNLERLAQEDLQRAARSIPPSRQTAYLDAAEKLVALQRLAEAEAILDDPETDRLNPVQLARERVLRAEISLIRDELDRALRLARRALGASNVDPSYTSRALDIKARVDLRQGRHLEAARTWMRRDAYLTGDTALQSNHERTWYALGHLDALALQVAGQESGDSVFRGWLDLAILFLEQGGDRHTLRTAVTRWIDANPSHPAAGYARFLVGPERAAGIRQIALLLPFSSEYGAAAQIVHDGFDAAHRIDGAPRRPQWVFYDVGGEASLAANYAGVAASDGADVIVGPLGKEAVNTLLETRQPGRPVVLLGSASPGNTLQSPGYQFDLAPEPEAQRVAEYMYASGHRRVAALYPDDEWGERVYSAFADHWEALGGILAEAHRFQPGANDYTAPIKNLFNLVESENRHALLEAQTGLNLEFEARRRGDLDALFMAARTGEARLLKPQIDFFQGYALPVYATSHVFTGSRDPVKDTDLDGITFPDMPWRVRETARMNQLKATLRDAGYANVSTGLFAFGFDAYQLSLLAPDRSLAGSTAFSGLTSELVLKEYGRVLRRPDWSRFKDGVPLRVWAD